MAKKSTRRKPTRRRDNEGLTPRERRFVEEYLVDLNGKAAAIRAGYSPRGADQTAARLLGRVKLGAAVARAKEERADRIGVKADAVLRELARIGFSDLRRVFTDTGELRAIAELDDDAAAALASVEVVTKTIPIGDGAVDVEHTHKVKAWDKPRALELLAKHLGILRERVEHSGPGGGPIEVAAIGAELRAKLADRLKGYRGK